MVMVAPAQVSVMLKTVAKPAADPRLLELLKLLDGLPDRENQPTDCNPGRDRAVTLCVRRVNKWGRRVLAGAGASRHAMSSFAMASSSWLGKQAGAIEARIVRYSEPFTKLELQPIRSAALRSIVVRPAAEISRWRRGVRLQHSAHDNARDFQKLLDEFERELNQVSQHVTGQADRLKENAPAEKGRAGAGLYADAKAGALGDAKLEC
jgi:hypothetical protein